MDVGPFRGSRPAARNAANRPESTPRQSETTSAAVSDPRPASHRTASHHAPAEKKSWKRFLLPAIMSVVVIAAGVVGYIAWSQQNALVAIDKSKYQAVFFTNGQVYFGKLEQAGGAYMKLTDIYYLQSQQSAGANASDKDSKNPQQTSTDQNNVQLIKLGDEIHGPEDAMVISKDQVLFYENLKSDGKVAQSIDKYKTSK